MFDFERNALVRKQIYTMLSASRLPMRPDLSAVERSVNQTEILSISSLSASDLHRADQLQLFEKLLKDRSPAPPNYTGTVQKATGEESSVLKRRYFRNISAFTFPQILSSDTMREPAVIKKYYPMTDELLIALHWPAPCRRMARESWSPIISEQTLKSLTALCGNTLTMVTATAASAPSTPPPSIISSLAREVIPSNVVDHKLSELLNEKMATALVQHSLTMTPAGNAIIMVKQTTPRMATWLSIYTDSNILGLRYGTVVRPVASQRAEALAAETILERELEIEKERRATEELLAKNDPGSNGKKKGAKVDKKGIKNFKLETPADALKGDQLLKEDSPMSDYTAEKGAAPVKSPEIESLDMKEACFFCHTEDDVRIVSFKGPKSAACRKPDRYGTVCLLCIYPSGLQVLLCSNGTVKCHSPLLTNGKSRGHEIKGTDPTVAILESARFIVAGATVVRHFSSGPYIRDVLSSDGTRTLVRRSPSIETTSSSQGADTNRWEQEPGFHASLLSSGPVGWRYVRLSSKGSVLFYTCEPGTVPESKGISIMRSASEVGDGLRTDRQGKSPTRKMNIMSVRVDAETLAEVRSFEDGRLIVLHRDGLREVSYADGTRFVTHPEGSLVFVSKNGLPSLEIDTDLDRISGDHSKGIKVPLAKGGDKVRLRIVLPDGSAAMIKYNTCITSKVNGSLKLVRRDRTVLLVKDDGVVSYSPRTAWDDDAAADLLADSRDAPLNCSVAGMNSPRRNMMVENSVAFADSSVMSGAFVPSSSARLRATDQAVRLSELDMSLRSLTLTECGAAGMTATETMFSGTMDESFSMNHPDEGFDMSKSGTGEHVSKSLASLNDPLLPLKTTRTKFSINLNDFTCRVEDHEHNVFDVSLKDPLSPRVTLSGEVEGLKPTAVSVSPMEPRLFIMSRSADAVEVLSTLKASELERMVVICPDAYKTVSTMASQPVELGEGIQHTYHFRRRSDKVGDAYTFEDVFAPRAWQKRETPAAVSMVLLERSKQIPHDSNQSLFQIRKPRTMETMLLTERMPLSQEGYRQLTKDFHSLEQYRAARTRSIDLFQIEDGRTQEELEEEETIRRIVKVAYKQARIEKKKQLLLQMQKEEVCGVPSELALKSGANAILEGDDEMSDNSDEMSVHADSEEVEIIAAFESFAQVPDRLYGVQCSDLDSVIQFSSLRAACIQILNCQVSQRTIECALHEEGYCDISECSLNIDEFKNLLIL